MLTRFKPSKDLRIQQKIIIKQFSLDLWQSRKEQKTENETITSYIWCAKEDGELGNMNKTVPGRVKWIKTIKTKLSGLWGSMILTALLYLKCSQIIQPSKYKIPVVFLTRKDDIIQKAAPKNQNADELN